VREIDEQLDGHVVARMILGSIAPTVVLEARERGHDAEVLEASALALLRGLTAPVAAPRR
jgi:hypothetical protein